MGLFEPQWSPMWSQWGPNGFPIEAPRRISCPGSHGVPFGPDGPHRGPRIQNLLKSKKVFKKKKHTISKKITHFESLINSPYKYGFSTDVNTDQISEGLNLETLQKISKLKKKK